MFLFQAVPDPTAMTDALGMSSGDLAAYVEQIKLAGGIAGVAWLILAPLFYPLFYRKLSLSVVNTLLAVSVALLIISAGNVAAYLFLRERIPVERVPDWSLAALCTVGSAALGYLIARWLIWTLAPPGQSEWSREYHSLTADEMSVQDYKRQQWMERRSRARHDV